MGIETQGSLNRRKLGGLWGGEARNAAEILRLQLFTSPTFWRSRPGQRVSTAATGPTEDILSAWSCAKCFQGIILFHPGG